MPKAQAANPGSLKGMKIVIDPGHSREPGALGPTGLEEADANLWISRELRNKLEKKGARVKMTRTGDEDVASIRPYSNGREPPRRSAGLDSQ